MSKPSIVVQVLKSDEDKQSVLELDNEIFSGSSSFQLEYNDIHHGLVIKDRARVGNVIAYILYEQEGRKIDITSLGVREDHRDKGLGSKLVDVLIHRTSKKGYRKWTLRVEDNDNKKDLIRFYEKFGFKKDGKTSRRSVKMVRKEYPFLLGCCY